MAKRLDEQGLVERTPYRGVTLTDRGRLVALEVLRHHRLLELLSRETLGDAARRGARRGRPPRARDVGGARERRSTRRSASRPTTLTATRSPTASFGSTSARGSDARDTRGRGECAVVTRVPDGDSDVLRYLTDLAIAPGASIEVVGQAPFDGPVTVKVGDADHALAAELAAAIGRRVEARRRSHRASSQARCCSSGWISFSQASSHRLRRAGCRDDDRRRGRFLRSHARASRPTRPAPSSTSETALRIRGASSRAFPPACRRSNRGR